MRKVWSKKKGRDNITTRGFMQGIFLEKGTALAWRKE